MRKLPISASPLYCVFHNLMRHVNFSIIFVVLVGIIVHMSFVVVTAEPFLNCASCYRRIPILSFQASKAAQQRSLTQTQLSQATECSKNCGSRQNRNISALSVSGQSELELWRLTHCGRNPNSSIKSSDLTHLDWPKSMFCC